MSQNQEHERFAAIAASKGHAIRWLGQHETMAKNDDAIVENFDEIHLDLRMLDLSLDIAIERFNAASQEGMDEARATTRKGLLDRLVALRQSDDYAEKANFVFGSGTYYFREDLQNMASIAATEGNQKAGNCHRVCELISYPVCRCACSKVPGGGTICEQICREMMKQVCSIICD